MTDLLHSLLQFLSFSRSPEVLGCRPPVAHPSRDWMIVLAVLGAILAGLAALDGWMYFAVVATEQESTGSSSPSPAVLTPQKLDDLLGAYAARDTEHTDLLKTPPQVIDPAK